MTAAALAERLHASKTGTSWTAHCPAHDDNNASLSISEASDGKTLLHCHAGCTFNAIMVALALKPADLFPAKANTPPTRKNIVKASNYTDEQGTVLFQSVRYEPKDFRQRRPDPDKPGAWLWDMHGVERVLYRLPEVLNAKEEDRDIFVAEGEKDVDALVLLGVCATCNPGGAGKWLPAYTATLTGAKVIVIADKDEAGRKHAALVRAALQGYAASVQVVELPDRDGHQVKDAHNWITAGGTVEELQQIVRTAPATAAIGAEASTDIRAQLWTIAQTPKLTTGERHNLIAAAVVAWLHSRGRFYYHLEQRDFASVMYFDTTRKLLLRIQSDDFLAWLADALAMNRTERSFTFVQSACETEGLSDRSTGIEPSIYWAATPGAFYLSNGPGRLARISPDGVTMVDNGTDGILFPYGATLAPWTLTDPADPFEACAVFCNMSTAAPHGLDLFKLWACCLPSDQRTKPPLCITSPVGGVKTRVITGLYELYGMPSRIGKVTKNGGGDFWASVNAGGLCCFDNVDSYSVWLADGLAAASTGGSQEKRQLYTDHGTVILKSRSWIALTSANPSFASDAGLADRLLVVRLNRRTGETSEAALSAEIAEHRDAGLSWITQVLSIALADCEPVPKSLNARHPDFAALAVRIGRAMKRGKQAITALRAGEADKGLFNLENDYIGAALLELLTAGPFNGTANELLARLIGADPSFADHLSVKGLSKRLAKIWPHLESVFKAHAEAGHGGIKRFSFQVPNGCIGGFQTAFSEKSLCERNINTLPKTPLESNQSNQTKATKPPLT